LIALIINAHRRDQWSVIGNQVELFLIPDP